MCCIYKNGSLVLQIWKYEAKTANIAAVLGHVTEQILCTSSKLKPTSKCSIPLDHTTFHPFLSLPSFNLEVTSQPNTAAKPPSVASVPEVREVRPRQPDPTGRHQRSWGGKPPGTE